VDVLSSVDWDFTRVSVIAVEVVVGIEPRTRRCVISWMAKAFMCMAMLIATTGF